MNLLYASKISKDTLFRYYPEAHWTFTEVGLELKPPWSTIDEHSPSKSMIFISIIESRLSRFKIRPRCLRNVSRRDLSTTVLGQKVEIPVGISPMSMQRMAHPEGECASVRGKTMIQIEKIPKTKTLQLLKKWALYTR